jgi:hypothetical protein
VHFCATMLPCWPSPARIWLIVLLVQAIREGVLAGGHPHDHCAASMMRAVSAASSICGQCPASSS